MGPPGLAVSRARRPAGGHDGLRGADATPGDRGPWLGAREHDPGVSGGPRDELRRAAGPASRRGRGGFAQAAGGGGHRSLMRWLREALERMGVGRREALLVGALVVAGVLLRAVIAIATKDSRLLGDQPEYHATGVLFAEGKPFWGLAPLGYPHPSLWKAPLYGAWVGSWYTLLGDHPTRLEVVQAVVGGSTIVLTWLLARRLFGRGVALAAAAIVTIYPLAWQFGGELYPEALGVPLVTLTLWL